MGEHVYLAEDKQIIFSESSDIGCLCTFPHNDECQGKLELDAGRVRELALLGAAVALLHNSEFFAEGWHEYICLPQDLGKYGDAIIKWFEPHIPKSEEF